MFGRMGRAANTGYGRHLWPVFALLTAVVVLPTAGVFWFMNQAMQNEQLAIRQRLTEIYRSQLRSTAAQIQTLWGRKLSVLAQAAGQTAKPNAFASLVKAGHVDSVLFCDRARVIYPELSAGAKISTDPVTPMWLAARKLEYEENNPQEAAEAYGKIVRRSSKDEISALALLAQARCLNKAGRPQAAIETLIRTLGADRFRRTTDAQGRLIQLNGLLFALELMKSATRPMFQKTAATLAGHLNEYGIPTMPSSQRRFLMQRLQSLWPDCPSFPTEAAEKLAAAFGKKQLDRLRPGQMQTTSLKDVWAYQTLDKSLVALFHKDQLLTFMNAAVAAQDPIPGIVISVRMPDTTGPALMAEGIGDAFPSWRLTLNPEGPDPFQSASSQKVTVYFWTGILMIAGVVVLSLLLAGFLRRQMRLTSLKNDLTANVSHELKTPLASIRLLVDTLRDGQYQDTQLVQEYLQMIAKENARLSSLIEEFLTFSRMERNKAKFDRSHLRIGEIVRAALETLGDRLQSPKCHLHLDLAPELPGVIGDRDALVTVIVNLLDNALKYSGDEKRIQIRSFASNGNVVFEVQDNGIGFPRSAARKIFDRFYQVDQTLSRRAGGCGLGLSIVQFIVAAHNGSITAKSQPGEGSTFTVQLPAASVYRHAE